MLWMLQPRSHASLRFEKLSPLVRGALCCYENQLTVLDGLPPCLNCESLEQEGLLKEKHWKFGVFMAAATSLPILYRKASFQDMVKAVCAKTSVGTSAKLLDNLNDKVHSYEEAVNSLDEYRSALKKGTYTVEGDSLTQTAERSAHEIATWVFRTMSSLNMKCYDEDVDLLVSGQVASLRHKKGKYPSMKEYLSQIIERSIGNLWIDVDLALLESEEDRLKEGNDYIFKSYLIYDDVQDIHEDMRINSVNCAVILGLERGILSESDLEKKDKSEIIWKLEEGGIFRDLLCLADLVYLKGMESLPPSENPVDVGGLAASLGMIRMFNMRRILSREKNITILCRFLTDTEGMKKVRVSAPAYICEMVEYVS